MTDGAAAVTLRRNVLALMSGLLLWTAGHFGVIAVLPGQQQGPALPAEPQVGKQAFRIKIVPQLQGRFLAGQETDSGRALALPAHLLEHLTHGGVSGRVGLIVGDIKDQGVDPGVG